MSKRLFIGNLSFDTDSAQLNELFSQVGTVSSCDVITDRFSGRSKGFAFVEYESEKEADEAIAKFNEHELGGRKMIVNVARPREERAPREFDRRGGGGGFDRNRRSGGGRDSGGSRGGGGRY